MTQTSSSSEPSLTSHVGETSTNRSVPPSSVTTEVHHGLDAFHRIAEAWNDLWDRTELSPPTVRYEAIELWTRTFGDPRQLTIVVVKDGEQLVAGIPLIRSTTS